jgi:hypothetical protein
MHAVVVFSHYIQSIRKTERKQKEGKLSIRKNDNIRKKEEVPVGDFF